MARAATFGGGTLSPFGGATADFGAFDIGASDSSKTVSVQQQAALAYSVAEAQHNNGLMTDAQFEQVQQTYLNGLDKTTATGATAAYTIAMTQYTNDYNAMVQAVQTGQADPRDLVAFNRSALAGVVPGSNEYMQRQDRLLSSEGNVYQQDEAAMSAQLQLGKITIAQAQDWYSSQMGLYGDNYQVQQDISSKIGGLGQQAIQGQDNAMVQAWNDGQIGIAQVVAYVSQAVADDPTGNRATQLQSIQQQAVAQNQQAGAQYRYGLTQEYEQLAQVIAAASTVKLGSTSKTSQTRTFTDPSSPTGWTTVTNVGTKSNPPTAAQLKAKADADAKAAAAKARMAEIAKTIGTLAGGWYTDQNMVADLARQQSLTVKNSPQWTALQAKIDATNQKIEKDKALKASGALVDLPLVLSELGASGLEVSSTERATATGLATKDLNQVMGWSNEIGSLKAQLAAGNLTDDQIATLNARISTDQSNIANTLAAAKAKAATTPAATKAAVAKQTASGVPATSTSGARATGGSVAATSAGPTMTPELAAEVKKVAASHPGATQSAILATAQKNLGLTQPATPSIFVVPSFDSPSAFDDFHKAMVTAVTTGNASFVDPDTGKSYALPTDPAKRLTVLDQIDQQNVNLKLHNLQVVEANPGASPTALSNARQAYANAKVTQASNKQYVIDTAAAGSVVASSDVYQNGVKVAAKGQIIKIADSDLTANHAANSLGYILSYADTVKYQASQDFALAADAMDRGDLTGAAYYTKTGNKLISDLTIGPDGKTSKGSVLDMYVQKALGDMNVIASEGAKITGQPASDLDRAKAMLGGQEFVEVTAKGQGVAQLLFGTPANPATGTPAKPGALLLDGAGNVQKSLDRFGAEQVQLQPGAALKLDGKSGKITLVTDLQRTGYDAQGNATYADKGEVTVLLKLGGVMVPVNTVPTTGPVGTMTVGGQTQTVTGAMVTYGGQTWIMDPTRPGVWIPRQDGQPINFVTPANWQLGADYSGAGNIPGVPAGTPVYHWSSKDQYGNPAQYAVVQDAAGFHLWQSASDGKTWSDLGTGITPTGNRDQGWQTIMGGFGLDRSNLTQDQRTVLNLVDLGVNKTGGALIGASGSDVANLFTKPGMLQNLVTGPGNVIENAWALVTGNLYQPATTPVPIANRDAYAYQGPVPVAGTSGGGSWAPTALPTVAPTPIVAGTVLAKSTGGLSTSQVSAQRSAADSALAAEVAKVAAAHPTSTQSAILATAQKNLGAAAATPASTALAAAQAPVGIEQNRAIVAKNTGLPVITPPPTPAPLKSTTTRTAI